MSITMENVLERLASDEPDYAEAAHRLGPEALRFLLELVTWPDAMIASKAASLAGTIGGRDSIEVLQHGARHPAAAVRAATAYETQQLVADAAESVLLVLFDDPHASVRKFAIRSAGSFLSSTLLRNKLSELGKTSLEPFLIREVAKALGSAGPVRDKWAELGWEQSFLGYPLTDEMPTPDGIGRYNHFSGGSIYWHPDTGAHEVPGAIQ
jgi:hypothetical protein